MIRGGIAVDGGRVSVCFTIFFICSGVSGDLGRMPGLDIVATDGGVEGLSEAMTVKCPDVD